MRISDSALVDAAVMSDRYIADRFLPDKAIDLVDEAAAKLKMEITSKPLALDEADRRVLQLEMERLSLSKASQTDRWAAVRSAFTASSPALAVARGSSVRQLQEGLVSCYARAGMSSSNSLTWTRRWQIRTSATAANFPDSRNQQAWVMYVPPAGQPRGGS